MVYYFKKKYFNKYTLINDIVFNFIVIREPLLVLFKFLISTHLNMYRQNEHKISGKLIFPLPQSYLKIFE